MASEQQPSAKGLSEPFAFSLERAMAMGASLKTDGMYVVVYRHSVSPERILGIALSLDGATRIALDSGEIEGMWVETEIEGETLSGTTEFVPVSSTDKRCTDQFRWNDDGLVIWGVSEFKPGHLGSQALEGMFQDEGTGIYCHWTTNISD